MKDCEKSVRDFVRLFVCLFFGGLAKICLRISVIFFIAWYMYIKSLTPYLGKILFFITFTDGKITKHVLFLSISFKIKMISVSNNKIIFTEETPTMLKKWRKSYLFYSSRSGFRKLDQIGIYPGMISDFLFNRLCFNVLFKGAFE